MGGTSGVVFPLSVFVDGCQISFNTATQDGGGIAIGGLGNSGLVTSTMVSFNNAVKGGGVWVNTNASVTCAAGTVIQSNDATSVGGGLYVSGAGVSFSDGELRENLSDQDGGGLYLSGGYATFDNVLVANNRASRDGGGMYLKAVCTVNLSDVIFNNGNSALHIGPKIAYTDILGGPAATVFVTMSGCGGVDMSDVLPV